jgi:hypothetical protein
MSDYEVVTLLSVRDEASAALKRFVDVLRDTQVQVDATLGSLRTMREAMAPSVAALTAQRESLGMIVREAEIRTTIAAQTAKQAEATAAVTAERKASLDIARAELAVQEKMRAAGGGSWKKSVNTAGNNMLLGGGGIIAGLAYATQKAMEFNQTALETDIALGGYNRSPAKRALDIQALQRAAFAGSEATGFFSAQQILEGLKVAASSGARPLVDKMGMDVFTQIAPALSKYMDIVGRLKGESPDQAAMEAIRASHMFGAMKPKEIERTLNAQAALALLMPDSMSRATNTMAYAVPSGVNLAGMSQEAILAFLATADQSGLGQGRAGARLKNYIEAIAMTQSPAREAAKATLGLGGALNAHGDLDIMKSFQILQDNAKRRSPQDYRDLARTAFGAQAVVVAAMFADPKKQAMFQQNQGVISQALDRGDLTTIQNILKGGAAGQEALMMARLNNDLIQFGQYGLPIAVKFFDIINPKLKQFGDWMQKHPDDAKKVFDGMLEVGAAMLALGAAFKAIIGISTAIGIIRTITVALRALGPVFTAIGDGLAAIGRALALSPFFAEIATALAGAFLTSGGDKDTNRKDLIKQGGYSYWLYLKGRHPGINPYEFNTSTGDMTPAQWNAAHPSSAFRGAHGAGSAHVNPVPHVSFAPGAIQIVGVTDPKAVGDIVEAKLRKLFNDPRSMMARNSPTVRTHPSVPLPLSTQPGYATG